MGRHRRSDAGRAATGRAADTPETHPEGTYAERYGETYGETYGAGQAGSYRTSYPAAQGHGYATAPSPRSPYIPESSHIPESSYVTEPSHVPGPSYVPASPDRAFPDLSDFSDFSGLSGFSGFSDDDATVTGGVYGSISSAGGSAQEPHNRSHRRKKRSGVPVRTGLLGVSAAVALGAVAVASGLIPGTDTYKFGGDHDGSKVQAAGSPTVEAQGGTDGPVEDRAPSAASRNTERATPSASPSKSAPAKPSAEPSKKPAPSKTSAARDTGTTKSASPSAKAPEKTEAPAASAPDPSSQGGVAAQVLTLVNQERAKAGCSPVTADSGLAALATAFSEDMAARDFFDHTDPDGATPWDRAKKAGITNLGGENIARGQANAKSVMEAWMNSPGHKANILNCDYKTLGVGVHFGSGGPWWTQDFGF
ncbi:CAP domain-containing protein [Streptomyces kunmingensis]|uniref:CAP domain-containing protein n=1 Tax=Streptomyces kunmingensis TaxID=68225 RepID=A0ABU6C962_9ACTN|nr:CAP domain-containing protein [Streptomyces kunmingensis]MEB3960365.1 CAP domain-containing protein [Streptomyces kunmingensis]